MTALIERARHKLAAGKLDDAARVVDQGLETYPGSTALRDLRLSIRRASAHKVMRRLESRIENTDDPMAYDELIRLYQDLELPEEARRLAANYVEKHPTRDTPHLLYGELLLALFLDDLSARHGHAAHTHLLRAANLNGMALQPRLLLAELYFCIDAPRSLAAIHETLLRMVDETSAMEDAFRVMAQYGDAEGDERIDGLFEQIEFEGTLRRDPTDWPLSKRHGAVAQLKEDDADRVIQRLLAEGITDEVVLLRRDGSLVTHASPLGLRGRQGADDDASDEEHDGETPAEASGARTGASEAAAPEAGFVTVVRTVSGKVFPQAREFDMGKFGRCAIRTRRGHVVVGRVGGVTVGARGAAAVEPERMWERLSQALESITGKAAA